MTDALVCLATDGAMVVHPFLRQRTSRAGGGCNMFGNPYATEMGRLNCTG